MDAVNALGFSALMKAAVQGHINCVSTLLEYGANDAIKDSGKKAPFLGTAHEWASS